MATHLVPFLTDLMRLYRRENRYHSFVHALDVLQAVYTFLELQGRVDSVAVAFLDGSEESGALVRKNGAEGWEKSPLALLSDDDLFLLCLAAIGHDVGHPGNSNAFLKNAQAPLSKLYEDKSALERMHCTLLLRLLRKHGMGHLISTQTERGREGRWLIVGTVLATDMSWHFEWVERFGRAMKDRQAKDKRRGSTTNLVVNSSGSGTWVVVEEEQALDTAEDPLEPQLSQEEVDREDRLFLCQAMMKCADISNPCRPHKISTHWSTVLLEEWAAQALLERHLGLPVSVVADANEKVQCVGQVSFIKLFTQPLFDIVTEALPGLSVIAKHCTENRILWENRLANFEAMAATPAPGRTNSSSSKSSQQMVRPIPLALPLLPSMARYAKTVFPLSLPSLRTKKQPPAARALASMSPWHAVTHGKKRSAITPSTTTGTSRSNTSGTSGRTSGSGNVWSHSRPDSLSSTSTLSSVGANGNGNGSAANGLSPTTPTSIGRQSSFYGRSPVSPIMSPFSIAAGGGGAVPGGGGSGGSSNKNKTERALPPSVWDVDPFFAEELRRETRRAWGMRDGHYRAKMRRRDRFSSAGADSEEEDNDASFRLRRGSLDITVGW
ncbi:hypothetical protein M408DRAFT_329699 [Serendipita vermifera MAFF 305830]|uniref:Phosphodiesterase n=1 Tax=Serendipita vermifera MAFF 305830 TaxID=933852 RepID=A0A0C3AU05_SERVB|nr:hypothetical protein M408DRAFT_329699 [Serendipita vermifera MAFF 305830]